MADIANEEQGNKGKTFNPKELDPKNQPPLTDEKFVPQQDGAIPQNAAGITRGQYDALDPVGQASVGFEQGNFDQILGLPQVVSSKISQIVQTFLPLVEVALVELLGNNTLYKKSAGQFNPSFDQKGQISIGFNLVYQVELWIGQDIEMEAIKHDATYVLNKIKPCKANITRCEIDTTEGTLIIQGTL